MTPVTWGVVTLLAASFSGIAMPKSSTCDLGRTLQIKTSEILSVKQTRMGVYSIEFCKSCITGFILLSSLNL